MTVDNYTWSLTRQTKFQFEELILMLENTDSEDQEGTETIFEAIRSLPGFPKVTDPGTAHIHFRVTDVQN